MDIKENITRLHDMKSESKNQAISTADKRFNVAGIWESIIGVDHKAAKRLHEKRNDFSYRRPLSDNGGRVCVPGLPESVPFYRGRRS